MTAEELAQQHRYRLFMAGESVLLLATVWVWVEIRWLPGPAAAMFGVLVVWHVVAIPICFLYLIGKPVVMTLVPLISSAESRAFRRQLRERPALSDDEFYSRFYEGSGIPRDIPFRLRHTLMDFDPLIEQIFPSEFIYLLDDDIDFADVLYLVEREFGVRFEKTDHDSLDGTFDNLVRLVQMRVSAKSRHFSETIEYLINQFLTESSPDANGLRQVVSRSHVLPLLLDMGGCLAVSPSGEIVSFPWDTPDEIRVDVDPRHRNIAIYQGSKKYPALQKFIPARPKGGVRCPYCHGKGKVPESELNDNLTCYCGGLGWLPPEPPFSCS